MKVLITGFDPFGGETINPAIEAVKLLPDQIENASIIKLEIPTVFMKSYEHLKDGMDKHQPDVVLCIGQAGGRSNITVERVAINIMDASIKDNDGNAPIDEPIVSGGPAAYFTNLPIKAIVETLRNEGIPASVSNSAGTFVCNQIMYTALHEVHLRENGVRAGFIHIPYLPEQVVSKPGVASMALNDISKGLELAIRAIVKNKVDVKKSDGKIC